jgi:hypothetical protein
MAKVEDNARKIDGQYPFPSPFAVDEHDDCPSYLDANDVVPDSVFPKFPPQHLKNATENFDEAAWGYSETRRRMHQQGKGTTKRKV